MPRSARQAATTAAPAGGPPRRSTAHAHRESLHPAEHQRVEPLGRVVQRLDLPPPREHCRQRNLAFEPRKREAKADMRAEAKRQVRRTVASQIYTVRLAIRARVAIRRVHHQKNPLASLQFAAVKLLRLLHDAHLRTDWPVVAQ